MRYIVVREKGALSDLWVVRDMQKTGFDQYSHELVCVNGEWARTVARALNRDALQEEYSA